MAHREFIYIGEPLPKLNEKEHAAFFLNLQKGILLSLKQRNLLTPAQYQECLAELEKRESIPCERKFHRFLHEYLTANSILYCDREN